MLGTVVKLGILAGVLVLLGVAIFRPATLLGVDAKALANSLGGEVEHAEAKCVAVGSGNWRCKLAGGNVDGVEYAVTTHSYGCWSGSPISRSGTADPAAMVTGCIGLADEFGS